MKAQGLRRLWLALIFLLIAAAACAESSSENDRASFGDDNEDDDRTPGHIDDDDLSDDDNDDTSPHGDDDDDDEATAALFIRPDLPINVYHQAVTHNTYIWRGLQGILSEAASMGYIASFLKNQVFTEIDVSEATAEGDFLINHNGYTNSLRLSSIFRNIRWWSDTRPGHPPIVLGFEWNAGMGETEMAALGALIEEFLIAPSTLADDGPLLSYDDWLAGRLAGLDEPVRTYVTALAPADAMRVVGYPTVRELQGRVLLETDSEMFAFQPAFFLMGGDGQIDNNSQDSLDDIALISVNRAAQRLTRMYTTSVVTGANYDLFHSLRNGVSNSALNHQLTNPDHPAVFPFFDEHWPGFAPDATVQTVDEIPARLGPPVFVGGFAAEGPATYTFDATFDPTLTLPEAPVFFFSLAVYGGETTVAAPAAVSLIERPAGGYFGVFAAPNDGRAVRVTLTVEGSPTGYEVYLTGPAVSAMVPVKGNPTGAPPFWTSMKFTLVDLSPTGRCAALGPGGERLFGRWGGLACDAGYNPSFLIEVAGN